MYLIVRRHEGRTLTCGGESGTASENAYEVNSFRFMQKDSHQEDGHSSDFWSRMLDFGQFDFGQFDFGQLAEIELAEIEIGRNRNWPKSKLAEVEIN